jgi:hypothetical protein
MADIGHTVGEIFFICKESFAIASFKERASMLIEHIIILRIGVLEISKK